MKIAKFNRTKPKNNAQQQWSHI